MEVCLMAESGAEKALDGPREEALRLFYELRDPLRLYLLFCGSSPQDAEEAVQESFLRLYQRLEKRRDIGNLRAWVFKVARNYLRDQRKSARFQRSVSLDDVHEEAGHFVDSADNPENSAMNKERARRLRIAIETLPQQQRDCILLRSSGLRYREIAEILGININNIGGFVMRASARLGEDLT